MKVIKTNRYKVIFDMNEEYEIISEVCIDNTINVVEK